MEQDGLHPTDNANPIGDETMEQQERSYFDQVDHSQILIDDEYDENPNDHSQAIYDQQSYHEEYVYGDEDGDNTFPAPEYDENGNAYYNDCDQNQVEEYDDEYQQAGEDYVDEGYGDEGEDGFEYADEDPDFCDVE